MPAEPWVSIIMPVYNGGVYFESALRSALLQDYRRMEIVVIDDGSIDGVAERVAANAGKRVRYLRQSNQGVAAALNAGLDAAKGDIFCWLSHDDLFLPHKLTAQTAYFNKLGVPDSALFSDYETIDSEGLRTSIVRADRASLLRSPMLALFRGAVNGCTVFAPMQAMNHVGRFDTRYRHVQDYRFWRRFISEYEFFHQPEVLVQYRIHPQQDSNASLAVAEADALWIDMMSQCSETERTHLSGSSYRFFSDLARHLSASPLKQAMAFAEREAERSLAATAASLVVPTAGGDRTQILAAQQSAAGVEVLVIHNRGEPPPLAPGARAVPCPRAIDEAEQVNFGLSQARGSYVAVQRPGRRAAAFDLPTRARQLQMIGAEAQLTVRRRAPISAEDILLERITAKDVSVEDLTLHRNRIDAGERFEPVLLALDDPRCLLPFCNPKIPVWSA